MKKETVKQAITGVVGFAVTALTAWYLEWTTEDLIWGFWGSSLVVGVTWTVALIAVSMIEDKRRDAKTDNSPVAALILMAIFCAVIIGFHLGYAAFLKDFFPLGKEAKKMHELLLLVAKDYWPIILFAMVSRFSTFPRYGLLSPPRDADGKFKCSYSGTTDPLMSPFKSIIRMHMMIFVLFGILVVSMFDLYPAMSEFGQLALYPVLFVFFCPSLKKKQHKTKKNPSETATNPTMSCDDVATIVAGDRELKPRGRCAVDPQDSAGYGIEEAFRYKVEIGNNKVLFEIVKFKTVEAALNIPPHLRSDYHASHVNGLFLLATDAKGECKQIITSFDAL
jgi:hypothetical protein